MPRDSRPMRAAWRSTRERDWLIAAGCRREAMQQGTKGPVTWPSLVECRDDMVSILATPAMYWRPEPAVGRRCGPMTSGSTDADSIRDAGVSRRRNDEGAGRRPCQLHIRTVMRPFCPSFVSLAVLAYRPGLAARPSHVVRQARHLLHPRPGSGCRETSPGHGRPTRHSCR